MANTITNIVPASVYAPEYRNTLQKRLKRPTNWKEVCRVTYTDTNVIANPYMSTTPTVADGTRGTANSFSDFALTNDTLQITDYDRVGMYIDWADLAQLKFNMKMEMAGRMGDLMNERLESLMLSKHAGWTDFDNASIGGAAGNITVSASVVDDIVRGIHRKIREANGDMYFTQYGSFNIWRPADFEYVEAFAQANGFNTADFALKNGIKGGFTYLGMTHYYSNDHTAGHLFGGVRKLNEVGICRSTWGQPFYIPNPAGGSGGTLSGLGIELRADFEFEAWEVIKTLLFDVLVA